VDGKNWFLRRKLPELALICPQSRLFKEDREDQWRATR